MAASDSFAAGKTSEVNIPETPSDSVTTSSQSGIGTHSEAKDPTATISTTESPAAVTSINSLPNEILAHILSYLDTPKPSTTALHDQPHFNLTRSREAPLKASSRVSKRWRVAAIPILFQNAQFYVSGDAMKGPTAFMDFISTNLLHKVVSTLTILAPDTSAALRLQLAAQKMEWGTIWDYLFSSICPLEVLIVAPAEALGVLTGCNVESEEAWHFDCPCHYLRLQRPAKSQLPLQNDVSDADKAYFSGNSKSRNTLFAVQPWTSLLLNEGSFIRAYATYEFWLRTAPSILPNLVGADEYKAVITPTIRDMSYIAIFPMSGHFADLATNIPRLDNLYVQLVPRNDIMQDKSQMQRVEAEDLWMERNASYATLMRQLFNSPPLDNYKFLKTFESGDAADREAWLMAVEFVKRAGNGWKVAGDGIFEKDPEAAQPASEGSQNSEEDGTTFDGALTRWAFNGTTRLPVSAYPLYGRPLDI